MEVRNICITEEQLVEAYGKGNPKQRFKLIYRNYGIFLKLVESYEVGLFNRILFEREYNRRARNNDDLGVRIQNLRKNSFMANSRYSPEPFGFGEFFLCCVNYYPCQRQLVKSGLGEWIT